MLRPSNYLVQSGGALSDVLRVPWTRPSPPNYFELTADLVSAYVSHNALPPSDLPSLIDAVHAALRQAGRGEPNKPEPAPRAPGPDQEIDHARLPHQS